MYRVHVCMSVYVQGACMHECMYRVHVCMSVYVQGACVHECVCTGCMYA